MTRRRPSRSCSDARPRSHSARSRSTLPPGAFLQASEAAEAAIRGAVDEAIGDAGRIADLFAGCGTLSLPLAAAGRTVHALERDPAMLAALEQAARRGGLAGRVTTERRDLQRAPLAGAELARFDALVVDPPRAGARAQAAALAPSRLARLALVSCNPATFARDARILARRRLALPLGSADRCLSVVEPDRAGGRVRSSHHAWLTRHSEGRALLAGPLAPRFTSGSLLSLPHARARAFPVACRRSATQPVPWHRRRARTSSRSPWRKTRVGFALALIWQRWAFT